MSTQADAILTGHVLTLDNSGTEAEAVAIQQGRVLATGSKTAMLELRGPTTEVRDFPGATLIPGFNDTHAHLDSIGAQLQRPSLKGARSIPDVLKRIAELAKITPAGEWIVTTPVGDPPYYFDAAATLEEGRLPNRYELDSVAPNHPVYIPAPSGFWGQPPLYAAMNSLGLQLNGVDRHTVPGNPKTIIDKDERGEPTGLFIEQGFVTLIEADLFPAVPRFTYAERRNAIRQAMQLYHRMGTTSIYEGHGCGPEILAAYREVWEQGELTMRTAATVSPRWRNLDEAAQVMRDWSPLLRGRGIGDALFRVSGFFIAHGGEPCIRAIQHKELDYMGWSGYVQQVNSTEEFEALCLLAAEHDLRVHTIVSDKLNKVLPVMERVARHYPIGERRWVLEHISRASPENLAAIRRLGLGVTLIPGQYLWKHGAPFLVLDESELDYLSPARQLYDLGVPVSAGTDAVPYNPLFCMWAMTTRRERTTRRIIGPGGRVSNEVALRLVTRQGAWLTFEEHEKGQLIKGHYADIAVLSDNPLTTPSENLRDIQCLATMVNGHWVYEGHSL